MIVTSFAATSAALEHVPYADIGDENHEVVPDDHYTSIPVL